SQAEDDIRDHCVTGVQTCALSRRSRSRACSDTLILRKVERARTPATMAMTRRVAFVWRLLIRPRFTHCTQPICMTILGKENSGRHYKFFPLKGATAFP